MPIKEIVRAKDLLPGQRNRSTSNSIRVDPDDEKVFIGSGSSGTTERQMIDTDALTAVLAARIGTQSKRVATLALVGNTLANGAQAWANPEGVAIIVTRAYLDITTQSSSASTLDVGLTTASATTSSDTLFDGVSGGSAALFDSNDHSLDSGANAKAQKLAAGGWVTVSEASGAAEGLVGTLYIEYIPVPAA